MSIGPVQAPVSSKVSVTGASTPLLTKDAERCYCAFSNGTSTGVWLNCGAPAVVGEGWYLPPTGGFREFKMLNPCDAWMRDAWNAISTSGAVDIGIVQAASQFVS